MCICFCAVHFKKQEKITEALKVTDQMEWVQRMITSASAPKKIVYQELTDESGINA